MCVYIGVLIEVRKLVRTNQGGCNGGLEHQWYKVGWEIMELGVSELVWEVRGEVGTQES